MLADVFSSHLLAIAKEKIHVNYSQWFCIRRVQTNFILFIIRTARTNHMPCLGQTSAKLYTLFRTERSKSIPCPAAHLL